MALLVIQLHTFFSKFALNGLWPLPEFSPSASPLPRSLSLCSSLGWKSIFVSIQSNKQNFGLYVFCIIDLLLQSRRTDFEVQSVQMCGGNWAVVPSLNSALDVSCSFTLWPLYLPRKSSMTTEQEAAWNPWSVGTSR